MKQKPLRVPIALKRNPYEVVIGGLGIEGIGNELRSIGFNSNCKVLIVSNEEVAEHYGNKLIRSLEENGFKASLLIIKAGESQKNQKSIGLIHDAAYKERIERNSLMIALGGGVIGDMTGFAAATWLRGIPIVQVPTTLLAMVDASIGGKTGVNHPKGKNLVGAFHQPKLVIIDPTTLKSLPEREFRAGMSEVIKYGVIGDIKLFNLLESLPSLNSLKGIRMDLIEKIIEYSVITKARVVEQDELEAGIRAILNYGHTFGHVVETLCGYGVWLHGEAVAIGMHTVGLLALNRGSWSWSDLSRQQALINKANLPFTWPVMQSAKILEILQGDKKVRNGKLRFVIPKGIGSVEIIDNVSEEEINNLIEKINR